MENQKQNIHYRKNLKNYMYATFFQVKATLGRNIFT